MRGRVTLVRHGQSTWNAEGRMQGSSDVSVLTAKGEAQAREAAGLLSGVDFDALFRSPLQRASVTADVVWGTRTGPVRDLWALREIDLYCFQGMLKDEGLAQYPDAYAAWKRDPAGCALPDERGELHYPVRELWDRGHVAWREVLAGAPQGPTGVHILVVAHNAILQAMLCAALGLPPTAFRTFKLSNAGYSTLDVAWDPQRVGDPAADLLDAAQFTVLNVNVTARGSIPDDAGY